VTEDDLRLMLLKQRKLFGSQQELARAIGVSEQNLYRFISGVQKSLHMRKMQEAVGAHVVTVRMLKPDFEL
jgi:DNA-binding Xre family transcriptional regulator